MATGIIIGLLCFLLLFSILSPIICEYIFSKK